MPELLDMGFESQGFRHKKDSSGFLHIKCRVAAPWRRNNTMSDVPETLRSVVRPSYLRKLREAAYKACLADPRSLPLPERTTRRGAMNRNAALNRARNPQTAHRRAFLLSLFDVFMSEATKVPKLRNLSHAHPRAHLPLQKLSVKAESSESYEPPCTNIPSIPSCFDLLL
jgi:hypothetical protein